MPRCAGILSRPSFTRSPPKLRARLAAPHNLHQHFAWLGTAFAGAYGSVQRTSIEKSTLSPVSSPVTPHFTSTDEFAGALCAYSQFDTIMAEDSLTALEGLYRDLCALELKLPVLNRLVSNLENRLDELQALLDRKPKNDESRRALSSGAQHSRFNIK